MLSTVNNDSSVRMDALVRIMYSVDKQFSYKSSFVLNFHQYDLQGTTCKVGVTCWSMQRTTIFTAPIISSRRLLQCSIYTCKLQQYLPLYVVLLVLHLRALTQFWASCLAQKSGLLQQHCLACWPSLGKGAHGLPQNEGWWLSSHYPSRWGSSHELPEIGHVRHRQGSAKLHIAAKNNLTSQNSTQNSNRKHTYLQLHYFTNKAQICNWWLGAT